MPQSFYNNDELSGLGLKSYGHDVSIGRNSMIYHPERLSLGDHVRIDDFCALSGDITIGSYVHISSSVLLYGSGGLRIGDYCGVSARSIIYTADDDFTGQAMVSPMVPSELTMIKRAPVVLEDFVQLGANTIVMPGVTCAEGAVTGVFSLVLEDLEEWTINFGIPCRRQGSRQRRPKELARRLGRRTEAGQQ